MRGLEPYVFKPEVEVRPNAAGYRLLGNIASIELIHKRRYSYLEVLSGYVSTLMQDRHYLNFDPEGNCVSEVSLTGTLEVEQSKRSNFVRARPVSKIEPPIDLVTDGYGFVVTRRLTRSFDKFGVIWEEEWLRGPEVGGTTEHRTKRQFNYVDGLLSNIDVTGDFLTYTRHLKYDESGNVVEVLERNVKTEYLYEGDRCVGETVRYGSTVETTSFSYQDGWLAESVRIEQGTKMRFRKVYEYDRMGNLVTVSRYRNDLLLGQEVNVYAYDDRGNWVLERTGDSERLFDDWRRSTHHTKRKISYLED